jgi:hypothetical protein
MVRVLGFLALALLVVVAIGLVVMMLWNALMPSLFGLRAIGFWEGLGLFLLARLLFGGFRGRGEWHWRHRMHERWSSMTPEERAKFREGMAARCGAWSRPREEPNPPA